MDRTAGQEWSLSKDDLADLAQLRACFGPWNGSLSLADALTCPLDSFDTRKALFWAIKNAVRVCPMSNPGYWLHMTALALERQRKNYRRIRKAE